MADLCSVYPHLLPQKSQCMCRETYLLPQKSQCMCRETYEKTLRAYKSFKRNYKEKLLSPLTSEAVL